jgi:hypothetical protein
LEGTACTTERIRDTKQAFGLLGKEIKKKKKSDEGKERRATI